MAADNGNFHHTIDYGQYRTPAVPHAPNCPNAARFCPCCGMALPGAQPATPYWRVDYPPTITY